jgi:membrane protease YdiL (CAAX protease family)
MRQALVPIRMTMDMALAPAPRWGEGSGRRIAHAVGLALAHQASLIVPLVAIAPLLIGKQDPFEAPPAAFLLLAVIAFLQIGVVVGAGLLQWGRVSLRDLGWSSRDWRGDMGRGVVGFFVVAAIAVGTRAAISGGGAVLDAWQGVLHYTPAQRALFLVIGLIAAFTEESIFRGYLQPSLIERHGRTKGVIGTAAFFSLYHLQFAPVRLLALFLIGIVYGELRARTGSLFAPAVANFLCWAVLGAM